ncbi:amino acid carrier protein [Mesonia oceanica]|uniref:Amino-acid carrier protein AlsT n=1 Tax=Mesonia oceanica TaxID=2687242 RepID=A0AC61YA38_9FLAO|nr:amino acid carrier protein [Mesonia oceanica]MAQ41150.1 sodium:alanine symporter [Mesonia sp.]VVV01248.1 Amino-acid carrier protein AlsT [Mesonia oceanica]|tara:strand:- start:3891 stop:5975 length:2085 start_codon:yes stop_codon:yes gene_type:complete
MRKYLLSALFVCLSIGLINAQSDSNEDFDVKAEVTNPSTLINDGAIELKVLGGTPPYTYKWTNQGTSLKSNKATGLVEGIPYDVIITDAKGSSVTKSYRIKAESITEHFNGFFQPIVDSMSAILFWDPFAALGIYDPVVYSDVKLVAAPSWTAQTKQVYKLEKWLKPEGAKVKKGEKIAIVQHGKQEETITASANGKLKYLVKEGNDIFDPNSTEDLIEQGAHYLAEIKYDDPIPLTHPNGDLQKNSIPFIVIWLVLGAIFFTIRMKFINIRGFKHSLDLAKGKYDDPNAPGNITHFQALATAVSATVGLGNIAGVAVAVSLGGAGATFWMIIAGLLGMSSKFVECTLGVKYRNITEDGRIFGGPMNYLRYGLEKRNLKGLGKFLAGFFAILGIGASFGGGNMFQANQSFEILSGQFPALDGNGFWFGIVVAVLVGVVIIGGINSIAKVTGKIVPFMAVVYVLGALTVIVVNINNIGPAFNAIIDGAFSPSALKGGVLGVLIVGFQRAAFSNEAGVGSAAIAHSAAKTNHPPSEGFVALLEPFIDTVVVCTLTALVLVFTGMHEVEGIGGVELTSDAFASVISWFPYVLAAAVFLFAFSTMISWSYYGMRAWTYLFGRSKKSEMIYKFLFLIFVVVGASISLGAVLVFSDMMILAMSFPNIIGLYIMSGEVREDLKEYFKKVKSGDLYIKGKTA